MKIVFGKQAKGVGSLYLPDEEAFEMMVEILDIDEEPQNREELENWIKRSGIENVFKKVIEINIGLL